MSLISQTFATLKERGQKALIPFITAGDPHPSCTVPLMHALADAGADVIELGVPFSDPMADGAVIARASERALAHRVNVRQCLAWVKEFRQQNTHTPVVLMGYANPIERMGWDVFWAQAADSALDGVLIVDYPLEESQVMAQQAKQNGVDVIFLVSPTTQVERLQAIARQASGYVYYVSLKGVTGAGGGSQSGVNVDDVLVKVEQIRQYCGLPVAVGFGIRDAQTAQRISVCADGVIVGSRLVELLHEAAQPYLSQNATGSLLNPSLSPAALQDVLSQARNLVQDFKRVL